MAEVTAEGYLLKTQNEYFNEEQALYIGIDPNWNLEPSTPDGLKIASDAEIFGNVDEALQQAYNSKDPNKARGVDLDIVSALTGTTRGQGTPSQVALVLTGVDTTIIPAGSTVESIVDESQWTTDFEVTIVAGTANVTATNVANGATQADPNTITTIVDTVGGWQEVDNPAVAIAGTNQDTDAELRLERNNAVGRAGNNQIDSMLGEILATAGVRLAIIPENDTNIVVGTLPPHSISPIVDGGTDADVALAIYLSKNPGVFLNQAAVPVSELVVSPVYPSQTKIINFSRPIDVPMVLVVDIQNDGSLPANVIDLVTQAILDYTQGELIDSEEGFNANGFNIGEEVPISRLFTPVNSVIGSFGNSYINSLVINGSSTTVAIGFNELSRWSEGNISVIIT